MPRNRQQIPKADREAEVVHHACRLFRENGYRGTTMADIARAAGIAPAAVHWYFATKDDLFAAALREVFLSVRHRVETDPLLAGVPRNELVAFLKENLAYRTMHREAYERTEASDELKDVYAQLQGWLDRRLLDAISSRLPDGTDVGLISDVAHVLFEGLLVSLRRLDRPIDDLIDLLIDALAASAVGARNQTPPGQEATSPTGPENLATAVPLRKAKA